ncbi:MAG: hypothetical protein AB7D43_08255, partial [Sulfurimonadaceae bacterium]
IGQDLAYGEDGKSHASGHVFGEENVKTKENDVWIKGWGGKSEVRTNHTWDMFRKSFEKDIAETKQTMLTINATEGGASIYGTLEIPFSEAIERYVNTKEPKRRIEILRAAAHERERIAVQTWNKVETMRAYVSELCEESKALFLEIAQTIEHPKEVYEIQTLQNLVGRAEAIKARYEEDIYEKVAWHIAQSTMLSKEIELAPAEVYIAKDELDEKERLWHLLERYKPWLFHFAGIMDAIVKTIDYAKVRRLIDEVQTIDVYCENKKIDSFGCSDMKAGLGRVFDVDMRGILYDVPDAYQDKIEAIGFKDAKTGEELPRTFVDVIRKDDAKYNELSFMKSLEEPIDEEKIKDLYCPNAIGFLATEENLEDEEFVGYINELMERFQDIELKGFFFENGGLDVQKYFAKSIIMLPMNKVETLIENIDIFISRGKMCKKVAAFLSHNSSHIYSIFLNSSFKNMTLLEYAQLNKNHKIWSFYHKVGLSERQKKESDGIFHLFLYQSIYDQLGFSYKIDRNENLFEYEYFIKIEHILKYPAFRQKVSTILNLLKGLS